MNVDAVILAWFAGQGRRARCTLDLASGVGAVALCLLHHDRTERVLLVDIDPALIGLAKKNLAANGWLARAEALTRDAATLPSDEVGGCDLLTCNPPYVESGRGRPASVGATARMGTLSVFTEAARRVLGPRGRACFVYPAQELGTLLATLRASGLEPKRLCFVHAKSDQPARVVLVEARPGKQGGLVVSPPVVEREADGPSAWLVGLVGGGPGDMASFGQSGSFARWKNAAEHAMFSNCQRAAGVLANLSL